MTRRVAITGSPVAHSRSPVIHRHWLAAHDIDGTYDRLEVAPETAADFYRDFAASGLVGCNVTVPNKEAAAASCDELDDAARAMGAVNTIWLDAEGRVMGANTDGLGFLGNLDQIVPGWDGEVAHATVLGAGGAARAVIWALLSRGVKTVAIVNRTRDKASALAERFGADSIAMGWDQLGEILGKTDLLVNTTSLGMHGQPPLQIDLSPLSKTAIVNDIVYVPLETPLLAAARARGNRVVDGLGMLLHQAVPGFERWFGVRPRVTEDLRAALLADLGMSE
ncbi:shikimate dehydrogenase [Stappia sp.]|uniref:shikimate dehydrogenase n=1 Tax=Stappia sp. TaxID=1870903 RepID=UPI003A9A4522